MIKPKVVKPTPKEEKRAYELSDERDDGMCMFRAWDCSGGVQHDHRKNRSQGGLTVLSNLQLLCMKHHSWKTDHPEDAEREGWAVPGWGDTLEFPAARWIRIENGLYGLAFVTYLDAPVRHTKLPTEWWSRVPEPDAREFLALAVVP